MNLRLWLDARYRTPAQSWTDLSLRAGGAVLDLNILGARRPLREELLPIYVRAEQEASDPGRVSESAARLREWLAALRGEMAKEQREPDAWAGVPEPPAVPAPDVTEIEALDARLGALMRRALDEAGLDSLDPARCSERAMRVMRWQGWSGTQTYLFDRLTKRRNREVSAAIDRIWSLRRLLGDLLSDEERAEIARLQAVIDRDAAGRTVAAEAKARIVVLGETALSALLWARREWRRTGGTVGA